MQIGPIQIERTQETIGRYNLVNFYRSETDILTIRVIDTVSGRTQEVVKKLDGRERGRVVESVLEGLGVAKDIYRAYFHEAGKRLAASMGARPDPNVRMGMTPAQIAKVWRKH